MPVRKSVEETVVVDGERDDWLEKCFALLNEQGFKGVTCSETLYQVGGDWKPVIGTLYGDIEITLTPQGNDATRMRIVGTGAVDNIYALFGSPGKRLIAKFKAGIH